MAAMAQRVVRHLFAQSSRSLYPESSLQRIAEAIAAGEATHQGQVVFAVESSLPLPATLAGHSARQRAIDVFSNLRVWDTAGNNGVLIYLLIADRRIEIVADRAIAARVNDGQWRGVCEQIEQRLQAGDAEAAALAGVESVSALLATHFPRGADDRVDNELANRPYLLD